MELHDQATPAEIVAVIVRSLLSKNTCHCPRNVAWVESGHPYTGYSLAYSDGLSLWANPRFEERRNSNNPPDSIASRKWFRKETQGHSDRAARADPLAFSASYSREREEKNRFGVQPLASMRLQSFTSEPCPCRFNLRPI